MVKSTTLGVGGDGTALEKVRAELSLTALAYNLRRILKRRYPQTSPGLALFKGTLQLSVAPSYTHRAPRWPSRRLDPQHTIIVLKAKPNMGIRPRFAGYHTGMTVSRALAARATASDIAWDEVHGFIRVEPGVS